MGEWRMDQVGEPKTTAPETAPPSAGLSATPGPASAAGRKDRVPDRVGPSRRHRRRVAVAVIGVLLLLGVGATAGWYTLVRDPGPIPLSEVPLVRADHTPVRMRPAEPGGIDVPHLDRAVLHDTDRGDRVAGIGTIAPPPEEPVARPTPSLDSPTGAAGPGEATDRPDPVSPEPSGEGNPGQPTAPLAAAAPEALIDRVAPVPEPAAPTAPQETADVAAAEPPVAVPADPPALPDQPESLLPQGSPADPMPATDTASGDTAAETALDTGPDTAADGASDPVAAGPAGPFLAAQLGMPSDRMSVEPQPVAASSAPAEPILPERSQPEGENRIQVAAVDSEVVAREEWVRFQAQYPDLLGDLQLFVTTVEVNGRLFYRIQGGLLTATEAQARCRSLQNLGADCIVR